MNFFRKSQRNDRITYKLNLYYHILCEIAITSRISNRFNFNQVKRVLTLDHYHRLPINNNLVLHGSVYKKLMH